ncbi:MAG: RNA methyltransferase [Deltaproteobacteria bacterium]|nr:RNA methyltransferase [Deltaproteobacteria bacterium]
MIQTNDDAIELLRRERVMTLTPSDGFRSLVGEIVGGAVKGSWWGHPRGKDIYRIATALEASDEVLVAKLVDGKVTFVHKALWPALYRVVSDNAWRERINAELSRAARQLWRRVEKVGEVRVDALPGFSSMATRREIKCAQREIETRAVVQVGSAHTDRGNHIAVLRSWKRWAPQRVRAAARRITLIDAEAELKKAKVVIASSLRESCARRRRGGP